MNVLYVSQQSKYNKNIGHIQIKLTEIINFINKLISLLNFAPQAI